MFLLLVFASAVSLLQVASGWQIVEELCETTKIASLLANGNWCSKTVPRCQWKGITCDPDGHFFGLELRDVPLNVPIPDKIDAPGIGCKFLKLVNCGLSGEVPLTMAQTELYSFDVSGNFLTGNLPWTWVATLNYLNVANNKMKGPSGLSGKIYMYMQHLILAGNGFYENLDYFPASTVPRMETFDVSGNKFFGRAPAFYSAGTYNIANNFFSHIEEAPASAEQPRDTEFPQMPFPGNRGMLQVCKTENNLFRLPPPAWMEPIYERCKYEYDPSNDIRFLEDFEATTSDAAIASAKTSHQEPPSKNQ